MSTTKAASNGQSVANRVVTLPATMAVEIVLGGNVIATLTADAEQSKKGNVWYEAKARIPILSDSTFDQILGVIEAHHNSEPMPTAKGNTSDIGRVITASAGFVRNGRTVGGGDPKVSFWLNIADMGDNGYGLTVTTTGKTAANGERFVGVRMQASPRPSPKGFSEKGHNEVTAI